MTTVIERRKPADVEAPSSHRVSAAAAARAKGHTGGGLYKPRTPIYPKLVHGFWRNVKWALLIFTLAVYYIVPWLRWHRPPAAPQQAVLVDFTHQRFYFFFIQLWPQEVYFITGLLVLAALALFLVTALFGRLWCGYACPQTVWTDLFIVVERAFEGDRNARMKLDAAPWSFDKVWRKAGKHGAWLAIAFSTGGAWIFYFHDAPTLLRTFWIGQAPLTAYVSCGLLTFTTYALAGTMREQVCTFMCPWPRIQGAMFDKHTLQVIYARDRGEPRGPHKKNETWEGRGDCIDCGQCVVVCPMGIDIRDGGQIECINCGLCVDACDEMMDRVGRPRSLIAYDTDYAVAMRAAGGGASYHLVRPRTILYAGVLAAVAGLMGWGLTHRADVSFDVLHDRNPVFVRLQDGSVRDGFTLKIDNRTFVRRHFSVSLRGLSEFTLKAPGSAPVHGALDIVVEPNQVRAIYVFVIAPQTSLPKTNMPITFTLSSDTKPVEVRSAFLSGAANSL